MGLRQLVSWMGELLPLAAAERVDLAVARAAVRSGMTGLCRSWRLVGCVVADTAGRAQPGAAVMKELAARGGVAGLVGFALLDCMHHSHNPAHPTPLG